MAIRSTEILNSAGMTLPLYCAGQSRVGINLAGTFVGTVVFEGSLDGLNFFAIPMTPFASGAAVSQATATGNWETAVVNYIAIRARLSALTSGSVVATAAASVDSSYQNAFIATTSIFQNSIASGAVNTLTQAAQTNRALLLKTCVITISGQPAWVTSPNLQIKDGNNVLWAMDIPLTGSSGQVFNVPLPAGATPGLPGNQAGLYGTAGNAMSIVVASAGGTIKTIINAEFQPI